MKTHNEELMAITDAIQILNDNDAIEMLKRTLLGAGSSFMRVLVN